VEEDLGSDEKMQDGESLIEISKAKKITKSSAFAAALKNASSRDEVQKQVAKKKAAASVSFLDTICVEFVFTFFVFRSQNHLWE